MFSGLRSGFYPSVVCGSVRLLSFFSSLAPPDWIGYLEHRMRTFLRETGRRWWLWSLLLMLLATACSQKLGRPSAAPVGDQAPVTLRNIQMTNIAGHRAVLMRLSRLPTLVRHTSGKRPAQIIVQAWGPAGEDLP